MKMTPIQTSTPPVCLDGDTRYIYDMASYNLSAYLDLALALACNVNMSCFHLAVQTHISQYILELYYSR